MYTTYAHFTHTPVYPPSLPPLSYTLPLSTITIITLPPSLPLPPLLYAHTGAASAEAKEWETEDCHDETERGICAKGYYNTHSKLFVRSFNLYHTSTIPVISVTPSLLFSLPLSPFLHSSLPFFLSLSPSLFLPPSLPPTDGLKSAQRWWKHKNGGYSRSHECERCLCATGWEKSPRSWTKLDSRWDTHRPAPR